MEKQKVSNSGSSLSEKLENKMADISLIGDDLDLFIDLWERERSLWDPKDRCYKNKVARNTALANIAQAFGRGWTVEEVKRKLESLKAYYRSQVKKTGTGSAGGTKTNWPFFGRIQSFLGTIQYNGGSVTGTGIASSQSTDSRSSPDVAVDDEVEDIENRSQEKSSDIALLTQMVAGRRSSDGATCEHNIASSSLLSEDWGAGGGITPPPPLKRKILGNAGNVNKKATTVQKPDFQETAVNFMQHLTQSRMTPENPYTNYGATVAERLHQLKSVKRVTVLRHKIDTLIHEALLEEMPDN